MDRLEQAASAVHPRVAATVIVQLISIINNAKAMNSNRLSDVFKSLATLFGCAGTFDAQEQARLGTPAHRWLALRGFECGAIRN